MVLIDVGPGSLFQRFTVVHKLKFAWHLFEKDAKYWEQQAMSKLRDNEYLSPYWQTLPLFLLSLLSTSTAYVQLARPQH
jgi:hypothetical protein